MARCHLSPPSTSFLVAALLLAGARGVCGLSLNVSALSAAAGESTLECWQMDTPFSISAEAGTAGSASLALGNLYVHRLLADTTKLMCVQSLSRAADAYEVWLTFHQHVM